MFGLFRYRYNVLKNVRVDTTDMKVYRKFLRIRAGRMAGTYWKQVDYKTTHELHNGECRTCPEDHVRRLLKTAF